MTEFNCGRSEVFWHTVTPGRLAVVWRGGEDPHSPPLLVCWNTAVLQVRGENKESAVRIETGHVSPDEARMGEGSRGASARQDACHS